MNAYTDDSSDGDQPSSPASDDDIATDLGQVHLLEEVDEYDLGLVDAHGSGVSRTKRKLYCFHCNRPEGHYIAKQNHWYYSFGVGLTLGILKLFGPFQCVCCGHYRLMTLNFLNPRYHYEMSKLRRSGRKKSKRRNKRPKKFKPRG